MRGMDEGMEQKETKKLSASMEDYLKEMYLIESEAKEIRVTDVAALLGISKASVNKAMKSLKEDGYIEHEHYGPLRLTEAGREAGKEVYDNYKVCLRFLTMVLEVPENQAETEAHLMEHVLTKATRKKLKKFTKKQKKS